MGNLENIPAVFKGLKPLIIGLIRDVLREVGTSSSGSGGLTTHDLSGSAHSGTLGIGYVPDALDRNGSRTLVGDLTVAAGITVDGVDISQLGTDFDLLEALFAAHDAATATAAHGSVGAHDHLTTGAGGQLDHGAALTGLGDDDHTQYAAAVGSAITRAAKDLDGAINKTWTGNHTFQGSLTSRNHHPELNDTYSLGTEIVRWKELFVSELETIILKYKAVLAVDGAIILAKQNGTFDADVSAVATTINFGQAMTVGNIIYIAGNLKIEYLSVGSLVSGTTYNVTRNLDGSGADAWAQGQAWINYGTTGDVRIEITGGSNNLPRIRLLEQGATYNTVSTLLSVDTDGVSLEVTSAYSDDRAYRFRSSTGVEMGGIYAAVFNASYGLPGTLQTRGILSSAKTQTGEAALNKIVADGKEVGVIDLSAFSNYGNAIMQLRTDSSGSTLTIDGLLLRVGGSSFPSAPSANDVYFRRDFRCWFLYDGVDWHQTAIGAFSAFPSSPVDNLRVYRTDRDLEYFYNTATSQWLTTELFLAPLTDVRKLVPYDTTNISTTEGVVMAWSADTRTYGIRVVDTYIYYGLGGTNTGSHYWSYRMNYDRNEGGGAVDIIGTAATPINTSALAASATGVTTASDVTIAANTKGGRFAMYLKVTGTPTGATFRGEVKYRYVG